MSAAPKSKRARRMWAAYVAYDGARDGCIGQLFSKKTIPDDFGGLVPTTPVFVLPADRDSMKAAVDRAAATILGVSDRQWQLQVEEYLKRDYRIRSKAALEAAWGVKLK